MRTNYLNGKLIILNTLVLLSILKVFNKILFIKTNFLNSSEQKSLIYSNTNDKKSAFLEV